MLSLWWLFSFILFGVFPLNWSEKGQSVAVCIGGQVPRLQPSLLQPLFGVNPAFDFKLFYSLQYSDNAKEARYWSDANMVFEPSQYSNVAHSNMKTALRDVFVAHRNVEVVSVTFSKGMSARNWSTTHFQGNPLTVITLPSEVPEIVFNMYAKQNDCLQKLAAFEQMTNTSFDYVFWAREDMHLYQDLNLHNLTQLFQPYNHTDANHTVRTVTCQLLTRSCLTHGGLSLRGYFWPRDTAVRIMGNRFNYYRLLQERNVSVVTVEAFEKSIMEHYNVTVCAVPVEYFPTVAVRHISNGTFCIPPMEVRKACYPAGKQEYVREHMCRTGNSSSDSLSGKSVSARVHAKVEAELAGVRKKLKDAQERNTLLERKVRSVLREKESIIRAAAVRTSKMNASVVSLSLALAEQRIEELQSQLALLNAKNFNGTVSSLR